SQTITVDQHMWRYNVSPLSFINRMETRLRANHWRVINQIWTTKLRILAVTIQVPIGVEDQFEYVVDLVLSITSLSGVAPSPTSTSHPSTKLSALDYHVQRVRCTATSNN
ncbi:hypothetical protein BJV78DRAFT_1133407, partial [Lactifluus subvellereus]